MANVSIALAEYVEKERRATAGCGTWLDWAEVKGVELVRKC
jgi:hypothetical protein